MRTEPNEPINAQPLAPNGKCQTKSDMPHIEGAGNLIGLSKREYFAGLAMQGYCANNECHTGGYEKIAQWSVEMADTLINALNQ